MSDRNLPVERVNIRTLSIDQRAGLSYLCFMDWATKGSTYTDIAETHNITPFAAKKLIEEHAAHERASSTTNKAASSAAYRYLISKARDVLDNPGPHPALVQAKAYEAFIQARTRLDKLEGTESPQMNITASEETVADWIRRAQKSGDLDISPTDHAIVAEEELKQGEIVEEGEVIY